MIDSSWVEPLADTLLHFIWQGLAVWLGLKLVIRCGRIRSARVNYLLGVSALALLGIAPLGTYWWLANAEDSRQLARSTTTLDAELAHTDPPSTPQPEDTVEPEPRDHVPTLTTAETTPLLRADSGDASTKTADQALVGSTATRSNTASTDPATSALSRWVDRHSQWIVGFWLLGVLAFALRWILGYCTVTRLYRDVQPLAQPWAAHFDRLLEQSNLSRRLSVYLSARIDCPAVVGWWKPRLLLPLSILTGLTPAQIEAIAYHEFAHVRRWDPWVNLLQCWLEAVLFFHPATWWVSRFVRTQREYCCDDEAAARCRDRSLVAEALARLERLRTPSPTLALGADGASLMTRIERLLKPESLPQLGRASGGFVALVIGLFTLGGAALLAQDVYPEPTPKNSPPAIEPDSRFPQDRAEPEEEVEPESGQPELSRKNFDLVAAALKTNARVLSVVVDDQGGFVILQLATPISDVNLSVRVRAGDTLRSIARSNGLELSELRRMNPSLDETRLKVGEKIHIAPTNYRPTAGTPVRVQQGDRLLAKLRVLSVQGSLISAELMDKNTQLRVGDPVLLSWRVTQRSSDRNVKSRDWYFPDEANFGAPPKTDDPTDKAKDSGRKIYGIGLDGQQSLGKVTSVKEGLLSIALNDGSNLVPGHDLVIARGDRFIGTGRVIKLAEGGAAVMRLDMVAESLRPRAGDLVIANSPKKNAQPAAPKRTVNVRTMWADREFYYRLHRRPTLGQELILMKGDTLLARLTVVDTTHALIEARIDTHKTGIELDGSEVLNPAGLPKRRGR